jgi:hypothetical protein
MASLQGAEVETIGLVVADHRPFLPQNQETKRRQINSLMILPTRVMHGWFILRVLMLHSNRIFAEAPVRGREHG